MGFVYVFVSKVKNSLCPTCKLDDSFTFLSTFFINCYFSVVFTGKYGLEAEKKDFSVGFCTKSNNAVNKFHVLKLLFMKKPWVFCMFSSPLLKNSHARNAK
jgi:hypothetical protein